VASVGRSWFTDNRGISVEVLDRYKIRDDDGMIVIPYPSGGEKFRVQGEDGSRRIWFTKGQKPGLFHSNEMHTSDVAFLVEGESDTMRLDQELVKAKGGDAPFVLGISGVDNWRSDFAKELTPYRKIYVILDNDQDYNVKAQVDAAWLRIRKDLGSKATRVILPGGAKDVCEFFDLFGMDEFKALVASRAKGESRFKDKLLDLSQPPPPVPWLVNGLVASGDVTMLIGDPNVGKSFLSMDLAVRLANGQLPAYWLGHTLLKTGNVLYVDEENPVDVVYHRLKRLGLTQDGARRLRYLLEPNIWLNKDATALLEEALDFEPVLIVLDSMARIHTEDENSASAMAQLFKEAIKPLARETGAAVLLLHHTTKGDGSSFQRSRGSGDITASPDAGLDVRATSVPGALTVSNYKSRRRLAGELITVRIEDGADGAVHLSVAPNTGSTF
jgi:hypothetical protein